jgi:hypothetical protein
MTARLLAATLAAALLLLSAGAPRGWAQDVEDPDVEVFDPLVTRNPMPERELEVSVRGSDGEDDDEEEDEPDLVGRPQVYLTPGLLFNFRRGITLRAGVQVPVTSAKEFDYRVIAVFNWEF